MDQKQTEKKETITNRSVPLKINSLHIQIKVEHSNIDKNIERINVSLANYSKKNKLDFVIFPEMALTGYNFFDKEHVRPLAEKQGKGKIFQFAQSVALRLNSYVVIGYPEIYVNKKNKDDEQFYNSAYIVDRKGNLVQNIRKKHLYCTDKTWAQEGQEFQAVELVNHEGVYFKTGVGICMDINEKDFNNGGQFEWADFLKEQNVDVAILIQNWVDSDPDRDDSVAVDGLLNYFLWRLRPLINQKKNIIYDKQWLFLTSNVVGSEQNVLYEEGSDDYGKKEKNTTFCGLSASIKINPETELIYVLEKKKEGILFSQAKLE
ncbi:Carbon-nitrogen hydrolase [Pseudocohnilembus persalinus]|uniref:Carbon-nitrogen hydrolase n=1 Tax=Pseudocohnilembus persalinus TaxID=266149 RepID=A0A0V0QC18_PSEPJ|nr:Carbon-nitrogen hydrolase [Pseudocohnilembus persalinus]|eukprot:KRW99769.1 Carbon-nitrogen hydrolase [Pseudocohnilembus persalinus]